MELFFCVLALIAGACAPTQAGINSQLSMWTEDPVLAAAISFAVGTLTLFAYAIVLRIPWPNLNTATELPWWMWLGGMLGAFLVAVTVILAPKLGAATLMGFMVTGQLLAGLVLDNYGLVGYEARPMNFWRFVGTLLLLGGVVLIKKF
jgi:bacterial/archaeal transporter family-2 protein